MYGCGGGGEDAIQGVMFIVLYSFLFRLDTTKVYIINWRKAALYIAL